MKEITILTTTPPRMRTIRQAAKETGFPEHALRQLVRERKIVFVKCGSKALVNLDKFIKLLNDGESDGDNNG